MYVCETANKLVFLNLAWLFVNWVNVVFFYYYFFAHTHLIVFEKDAEKETERDSAQIRFSFVLVGNFLN